jgi:nucleotide-binding universal stress UspA family protein
VPSDFVSDVVLAAGKPVLIVPYVGHFDQVGKRSFVAWNATREAARALTDALPMLERADGVEVAWFDPGRGTSDGIQERARADTAHYLEQHGIRAHVARHPAAGLDVGDLILSRAADAAADSIVMGAYGHSRLRERILGGATRNVLKSMTVPVLMSH